MKRLVEPGTVRAPGGRVLVDGTELGGAKQIEVTSNGHYQADRYTLTMALNDPNGQSLDWWGADARKGMLVDVRVSLDGDERSMLLGEADRIRIRLDAGTVEISGRDLTSRLIDARTQEAFVNRTSSEIATILAIRRGLTPVVTPTTTPVSRFYNANHDHVAHVQLSRNGTEWDMLIWLAHQEGAGAGGFDVYVKPGTTELHFEPTVDPSKAEPYLLTWDQRTNTGNAISFDLDRSLTLAKDVVVVVRSWHSGQGRSFSRASPYGSSTGAIASGKQQRYVITRPDLSETAAQQLADNLRADITKHERKISFTIPGELNLSPRDIVTLQGAGGWDQPYFVDSITRRLAFDSGFVETVTAKNHNIESESASP